MNAVSPNPILPLSLADAAGLARWVPWQTEERKGRRTKVPYSATGSGRAKADDPRTWGDRAQAERRAAKLPKPYGMGGVGLELGDLGDGRILAGIDLDTCRDESGIVAPWALEVVERLASYAEVSPSGTGLKLFFLADSAGMPELQGLLTPTGGKVFKQPGSDHPPAIEAYFGGRYFAVTGQRFDGTPADLRPVPHATLLWLLEVAGPAFVAGGAAVDEEADDAIAAQERPAPRRAKGGDKSRSALAFKAACQIKRDSGDYVTFLQALDHDPATADWKAQKGAGDGGRELQRCWDRASTAVDLDVLLTEHGVAEAFTKRFGDRLRYCHDAGAWFEWSGTHWCEDRKHAAFSYARALVADANKATEFKTQAITGKASFAAGVERFTRADPVHAVTSDDWDRDPFLLATPGGAVDLRTGRMRAAQPADMVTRVTAVAPSRQAPPDLWLRFLDDLTNKDDELIRWLQRWCGYCLTGDTREHALMFGYGPGGNGKSVFLNTVAGIMGTYAAVAAMDTFTASPGDKHPTDLAMLRGARLVTASETEEGRAWAESRIKQMTGGDPITARFMRQNFFTFRPTFKLLFAGNHKPVLRNMDDAARRRFNIVPFTHTPATPDRELETKLKAEWPGILAWMIEGCLAWQLEGLQRPAVVAQATGEYFEANDYYSQWLAECCDLLPTASTKPLHLLHSFTQWCQANGEAGADNRKLRGMIERTPGVRYATINGVQWVRGIAIKPSPRAKRQGEVEGGGG